MYWWTHWRVQAYYFRIFNSRYLFSNVYVTLDYVLSRDMVFRRAIRRKAHEKRKEIACRHADGHRSDVSTYLRERFRRRAIIEDGFACPREYTFRKPIARKCTDLHMNEDQSVCRHESSAIVVVRVRRGEEVAHGNAVRSIIGSENGLVRSWQNP